MQGIPSVWYKPGLKTPSLALVVAKKSDSVLLSFSGYLFVISTVTYVRLVCGPHTIMNH